jgi:SprA family protein
MIIQSSSQALHPLQSRHDVNHARNREHVESDNHAKETTQPESTTKQQPNLAEQRQISELRSRDQEVRAHELAHLAAAGGLSKGGPTFEFVLGPDGQRYAVGGEVQIDTSRVSGDPEATLQKAQQIQQAALAPAQPSAQDRSVAVAAAAMAAEARAEIASQKTPDNDDETSVQRIAAKVNDTYNAITDADTQRTSSLIDLVV